MLRKKKNYLRRLKGRYRVARSTTLQLKKRCLMKVFRTVFRCVGTIIHIWHWKASHIANILEVVLSSNSSIAMDFLCDPMLCERRATEHK